MLEVSDRAADLIAASCRKQDSRSGGYRIRQMPDQQGRNGLRVGYAPQPEPNDRIVKKDDAQVYIAPDVESLVDAYVLDAKAENDRHILVLRKPDDE